MRYKLRITLNDFTEIDENKKFKNLNEFFTEFNCCDSMICLKKAFNVYKDKYKDIQTISLIELPNNTIIDEYNTERIRKGFMYRFKIHYNGYTLYDGYYSCKEDFIEDLDGFVEYEEKERLLKEVNSYTFEDIIEMNRSIYKDAKTIQIIRIENDKNTIVA